MTQDTELLDVSEARRRLLDHFPPLEITRTPLGAAVGQVLAEEILAPYDFPLFPNASMDGFALQSADVAQAGSDHPVTLVVVGDVSAGSLPEGVLQSGTAVRIMTGAMLPQGSDAVVPVEYTDFNQRQYGAAAPQVVRIFNPVKAGDFVRPVGQDLHQGEVVLTSGRRIRSQDAGFLSMLGRATVMVRRRPRVAIFSSGDELLPAGQPLLPGKIYDANSIMLAGLVKECGGETLNLGIIPDQPEAVHRALAQAIDGGVDLIVSSAGVSVGAFDVVRAAIEQEGKLVFWRVNMRPGKPLVFGYYRNVRFVGLPGNPVSSFVGFEVFLRPALRNMLGLNPLSRPVLRARLLEPLDSDGRESYLRAIVDWQAGDPVVRLTGHQGSGNLRSLVQANALLFVPSGVKYVPSGAQVDVWLLGDE